MTVSRAFLSSDESSGQRHGVDSDDSRSSSHAEDCFDSDHETYDLNPMKLNRKRRSDEDDGHGNISGRLYKAPRRFD